MKNLKLKLREMVGVAMSAIVISGVSVFAHDGKKPSCTPGVRTIKNFLATAMQPVGKTLYIWGGGWDSDDEAAGDTAKSIGVSENWEKFFNEQNSEYDFSKFADVEKDKNGKSIRKPKKDYISSGLDCSGYRGWILYNTFHKESDVKAKGYVCYSGDAETLNKESWFTLKKAENNEVTDFKAGDIMLTKKHGHTYMVIGQCEDGSVVFVHSSPPGVHICGTCDRDGKGESQAVNLASEYMKKYYKEYDEKFSSKGYLRSIDYLKDYDQLRWKIDNNGIMVDPDGYTGKKLEDILKDLFDEK